MRLFFLIVLFCHPIFELFSQEMTIQIKPHQLSEQEYFNISTQNTYSFEQANQLLLDRVDSLRNLGYLAASIDSIQSINNQVIAYAYLGERFTLQQIQNQNIDQKLFDFYFPENQYVSFEQVARSKKQLLTHLVADGYINAEVSQQVVSINEQSITLQIGAELGYQYQLDSLYLVGDIELKDSYILTILNQKKGEVLNEKFFNRIDERIATTSFMVQSKPPAFELKEDGTADVFLTIDEKNANEFDLLIGFLPNPNPQITNQKLLITGQGRLHLFNPFGTGKEFLVDYEQLQPESPRMDVDLQFPQIFNQEFGLFTQFNLYKQDSSFVKLFGEFGLDFPFGGNKKLGLSYQRTNSFLQHIDTTYVIQNQSLPKSIDFNQNYYFATFKWQATNRLNNPSKGLNLNTKLGVGSRTIIPNQSVTSIYSPDFDFSSLYSGINDEKFTWQAEFLGQYFIPLNSRNVLLLQNKSGIREFSSFYENDLYRLGGINSVRGFDEQSYLASTFIINTGEYRFLLNRDSYFSVFGDWALLEDQRPNRADPNLLGIGTGLNLATKAGLFSLNLAAGKSNETSFDLNKTRIHIGYVNVF